MAMVTESSSLPAVEAMVQRVLSRRRLSRHEHMQLTTAILGNPGMAVCDRNQINRVLDNIRAGKVQLVN